MHLERQSNRIIHQFLFKTAYACTDDNNALSVFHKAKYVTRTSTHPHYFSRHQDNMQTEKAVWRRFHSWLRGIQYFNIQFLWRVCNSQETDWSGNYSTNVRKQRKIGENKGDRRNMENQFHTYKLRVLWQLQLNMNSFKLVETWH